MDISVTLSTYKRPDILSKTLASLCVLNTKDLEWEILIVDNADDALTKNTVDTFKERIPVKYFIEKKPGKNSAMNRIIPEIKGTIVVFTDDDILADKEWLKNIWKGVKKWKNYSIFGGRILPSWPEGLSPPDFSGPLFINAYSVADWNLPEGPYNVGKVFGSNMVVRSDIFRQGWRFNEHVGPTQNSNYIMGSETEFLVRLNKSGYESVYLPDALVYHQIREEQLDEKWLLERAFRAGRGYAINESFSDVPLFLGVPRFLFRRYIENRIKFFIKNNKNLI
jgi:glycosyltransferase involved in cell wall biosynthesis